jgi:hypothetical protein
MAETAQPTTNDYPRFAAVYYCGHALDGDGDKMPLERAYRARSATYHWQPCYYCLHYPDQSRRVAVPPSSLKYKQRHPFAPPEGD